MPLEVSCWEESMETSTKCLVTFLQNFLFQGQELLPLAWFCQKHFDIGSSLDLISQNRLQQVLCVSNALGQLHGFCDSFLTRC